MKKVIVFIVLGFCFQSLRVQAQTSTPIVLGRQFSIHSTILQEERELMVYLPKSFDEASSSRYPVLLVFDAEVLFVPTAAAVHFMHYGSEIPQIPEMIVVGIPNTNRQRDMPIPQRYFTGFGEENLIGIEPPPGYSLPRNTFLFKKK